MCNIFLVKCLHFQNLYEAKAVSVWCLCNADQGWLVWGLQILFLILLPPKTVFSHFDFSFQKSALWETLSQSLVFTEEKLPSQVTCMFTESHSSAEFCCTRRKRLQTEGNETQLQRQLITDSPGAWSSENLHNYNNSSSFLWSALYVLSDTVGNTRTCWIPFSGQDGADGAAPAADCFCAGTITWWIQLKKKLNSEKY